MKAVFSGLVLAFATGSLVFAGNAIGWRTDGTGRYPTATPVVEWSATKNVVWKTKMPSWSNSTPVLVGDRIFVCSEPATLVCVNAKDGSILWQKPNTYDDILSAEERAKAHEEVAKARAIEARLRPLKEELRKATEELRKDRENQAVKKKTDELKQQVAAVEKELEAVSTYLVPKTNSANGYSTCTPVTDGTSVFVVFGTGVVAAYDLEGNRKWARLLEKPTDAYGHSASPVLAGDVLIVHILDVTGLDKATGKTIWQTPAPPKWGSPVVTTVGDTIVVITPMGDIVRVSDGKLLATKVASLEYCAPIVSDNIAYFVESGGKAVQLSPTADGGVTTKVLWTTTPKKDRYYASPVLHNGLLYAITQAAHFSVIDAATGKVVYEKELQFGRAQTYPSVTLGGDYIFLSRESGTTVVFKPGKEPQQVAENQLETFRSCPVFIGKRMYVRTTGHLYCIGE